MTKLLTATFALVSLGLPCRAAVPQGLQQSADLSNAAATASTIEGARSGAGMAVGEAGAPAVSAGNVGGQFRTSMAAEQPALTVQQPKTKAEVPAPGKGGILKGAGDTLKKYTPHLLTAGIGAAGGAAIAAVAGTSILGGALFGGALGLAGMYLVSKGQTGAAIGAVSFGIAGMAVAGPVGGLIGAVAGGLGAWLLGKFFS